MWGGGVVLGWAALVILLSCCHGFYELNFNISNAYFQFSNFRFLLLRFFVVILCGTLYLSVTFLMNDCSASNSCLWFLYRIMFAEKNLALKKLNVVLAFQVRCNFLTNVNFVMYICVFYDIHTMIYR